MSGHEWRQKKPKYQQFISSRVIFSSRIELCSDAKFRNSNVGSFENTRFDAYNTRLSGRGWLGIPVF